MKSNRKITRIIKPIQIIEGAGVRLQRCFPSAAADHFDPFLLLDDFSNDNPEDVIKGFPWHPHRGIETVTYILDGAVNHGDSLGNSGQIGPGDVQWMTSGSGIMHEEMPQPGDGRMEGFQLWVNLPAAKKMSSPRYQDVPAASIPVVRPEAGVTIRIIAGRAGGAEGPVTGIAVDPVYLDVELSVRTGFTHPVPSGHTAMMYVLAGGVRLEADDGSQSEMSARGLVVFGDGDRIVTNASGDGAKYLLISGKPLNEPIARYGPFVMNTREEIEIALSDLRRGTFVK
jgi:redox-sensitive bicupin YhaK (pirin superfamily)